MRPCSDDDQWDGINNGIRHIRYRHRNGLGVSKEPVLACTITAYTLVPQRSQALRNRGV
jgi:hypothetical protein